MEERGFSGVGGEVGVGKRGGRVAGEGFAEGRAWAGEVERGEGAGGGGADVSTAAALGAVEDGVVGCEDLLFAHGAVHSWLDCTLQLHLGMCRRTSIVRSL